MNCAACAKNDICLLKKNSSEFRSNCSRGLQKSCDNCMFEACKAKKKGGYCKAYRSTYNKSIIFNQKPKSDSGIIL